MRMAESIIEELQRKSAKLRERLDEFRRLLDSVSEPRTLDSIGSEVRLRAIRSLPPAEIALRLRELALHCQSLARGNIDVRAAQELEEIGIDLAVKASALEAILTVPNAARGS
jgi:hypothetical protein